MNNDIKLERHFREMARKISEERDRDVTSTIPAEFNFNKSIELINLREYLCNANPRSEEYKEAKKRFWKLTNPPWRRMPPNF